MEDSAHSVTKAIRHKAGRVLMFCGCLRTCGLDKGSKKVRCIKRFDDDDASERQRETETRVVEEVAEMKMPAFRARLSFLTLETFVVLLNKLVW